MARKRIVKNMTLQEQANEILRRALEKGVSGNFFFVTTFKRYQVQLKILSDLESEMRTTGTMITKTYVKGRENVYTHPAVTDYNRTATAANQTVQTLLNIITTLAEHSIGDGIPEGDD